MSGLLNNLPLYKSAEISLMELDTIVKIYRTTNRLDFDCTIFKLALALIGFFFVHLIIHIL